MGGPPGAMPEKAVEPRSSRGASRLRMATGGEPPAPDGGASIKISATARQRVAGHKVPDQTALKTLERVNSLMLPLTHAAAATLRFIQCSQLKGLPAAQAPETESLLAMQAPAPLLSCRQEKSGTKKGTGCRRYSCKSLSMRMQDGAGGAEGPARKKRKRNSGAGLKELGLTSDEEEDSDDEWGSSGDDDDDDDDPDDGSEVDAGPIGATHPLSG